MPKVSVIVPVYKVEKYIGRCITSILNQTFNDFELILVDDGSPDRSGAICDEYAEKDSRITVLHNENSGASIARNIGIDYANGEWVAFVDSDDEIEPEYLCTFVEFQTKTGSQLVAGAIGSPGQRKHIVEASVSGADMISFIFNNNILDLSGPVCKLFNNSILKKYNIKFPVGIHMGEDAIFLLQYLNHIDSLSTVDYCGYLYNEVCGSLSSRYHSFESEYKCFTLWRDLEFDLIRRYDGLCEIPEKIVWYNRVDYAFERAVYSIFTNFHQFVQQYRLLAGLNKSDVLACCKYGKRETVFSKYFKYLLSLHLYVIFILSFRLVIYIKQMRTK